MELRHLRHFIGVAEELHFGRAAERLHIEQSPLSKSIKDLEADLGVKLFDRNTRSTRLTSAGETFLHEARKVIIATEKARLSLTSDKKQQDNLIRIAITENIAHFTAATLLAQCLQESAIKPLIYEMPESQLETAIQNGKVDIGISSKRLSINGYISEPLWNDSLLIAIPLKHSLATLPLITTEDLLKHPLIPLKPITHYHLIKYFRLESPTSDKSTLLREQASTLETFTLLVSSGFGVGIGTRSQLSILHHSGCMIRPIEPEESVLTYYLLQPESKPSKKTKRFLMAARTSKNT